MNILSLFDGISCGKVALERAGIVCDKYYSNEIDKYAIQVSQANYPDIIQLGDVKNIDTSKLPKIDLLLAGFPCQSFSIAGKGKGFEDERGNLFFDLMRIFKEIKPKYFLFENVASMRKEHREKFDEIIGVKSIMINSSLVSAQQRKRLYWCNWDVEQPEDKGILLKDIIESGGQITEKAYTLTVKGQEGLTEQGFNHYLRMKKDNFIIDDSNKFKSIRIGHFNKGGQADRIYSTNGKSVALSALGGGGGAKTGLYCISSSQKHSTISQDKSSCLTSSMGTGGGQIPYLSEKPERLNGNQKLDNKDYFIRKLTPIECERLQTLTPSKIYVKISTDINKIELEWLKENQNTNVQYVTEKCLKSQNAAGNVEKLELKEFALYVEKNLNLKNPPTEELVQYHVHINLEELSSRIEFSKGIILNVEPVEKQNEYLHQRKMENFVLSSVGILSLLEKITPTGKVELHQKDNICTALIYGEKELKKFGEEIMLHAKDAEKDLIIHKKLLQSIMLSDLETKNIEQRFQILLCYVMNVINGFIPNTTRKEILLEIDCGYTYSVSNTQRYKCLGNGWTVDVITHILKGIKEVHA